MPDHDDLDSGRQADGTSPENPQDTPQANFQRARMSRRQMLKKLGISAGASAALLFSDSFLRLVAGKLSAREGDEAYADSLSQGLRQAGSTFARQEAFAVPGTQRNVRAVKSSSRRAAFAAAAAPKVKSSSRRAAFAAAAAAPKVKSSSRRAAFGTARPTHFA